MWNACPLLEIPLCQRCIVGASFDQDSKRWHVREKNMAMDDSGEEVFWEVFGGGDLVDNCVNANFEPKLN